jgi:putative FmdB family regulatory protein
MSKITYEYYCESCKNIWEGSYPINYRDLPTTLPCPSCKEYTVKRSVGCAGFRLKGFCWSRDNYSRLLGDDPRGVFEQQKDE